MNERELSDMAEQARQALLSIPKQTVWQSLQKEPFGSAFVMLLLIPFTAIPYALVAIPVEIVFGLDLWDHPVVVLMWLQSPIGYSLWLNADNEKKHRARQKHLANAFPTSVAKAYCETFPRSDELWPAMDHLWREGRARSFGAINSMMLDSIERTQDERGSESPWSVDDDDPSQTPI